MDSATLAFVVITLIVALGAILWTVAQSYVYGTNQYFGQIGRAARKG